MGLRGPKPGTLKTPGSGRKKGTPNQITGDMKAEAWRVFNELQNDPKASLLTKAMENPNWFYTVFGCRLLPRVIEAGENGEGLKISLIMTVPKDE